MMNMKNFALVLLFATLVGVTIASGPGGQCGGSYGGCSRGMCCSKYGFCGSGPSYCGHNIPLSEIEPTAAAGQCGRNRKCSGGLCCSKFGYCGSGSQYCSLGMCQGKCLPDMPNHPLQIKAQTEAAQAEAQLEAYNQAVENHVQAQIQVEAAGAGAP